MGLFTSQEWADLLIRAPLILGGPVTNTSESAICMLVHSQSYFRVSPPGRWKGALSPRLPLPLPAHTMPQESWELVRDGLSGSQRRC